MELKLLESDPRITHIALDGRLDFSGVEAVEHAFLEATVEKKKPAMVDMSNVTFVVSLGIRMLLGAAKAMKANNCQMALVHTQPLVAETLKLAKLDKVFILADSEEEAIRCLTEGSSRAASEI